MGTFTSYDQVGLAEDVSDVISNISPTKTPFQASIGDETISAKNPEWQEDELSAVEDNAEVEGFDATDADLDPTTMRQNYTQIFSKTIKVAMTSERVKKYGRKSEIAYQLAKKGKEIRRDLEHTLVGLDQAAAAGSKTVARRMASVYKQIAAAHTFHGEDDGDGGYTARALDEATVLEAAETLFNAGGDMEVLMIKPGDATKVADFAKSAGRERDFGGTKRIVNVVDLYVSPYGTMRVVLNRFLKTTEALLYAPENWKRLVLRNWFREKLAKTGDNEKHMLVGEFSLKHVNQKASARITDLS